MGVDYLNVEFANPNRVYCSGDSITACVVYSVSSMMKINKIICQATGKAKTYWEETYGKTTYIYRGEETYFNIQATILERQNCDIQIMPGSYRNELTFELPHNIPPTYVGKRGKIEYSITAIIDRPWKFDKVIEQFFVVKQVLDLNEQALINPNIKEPAFLQLNDAFCCCFNSGEITANIKFPFTGFIRGQKIPFTVTIENESSLGLRNLLYGLHKTTIFYTSCRGYKKKKNEQLLEGKVRLAVSSGTATDVSSFIQIPDIPFENLMHCQIIDVNYVLRFQLETDALFACTDLKDIPLTFGTISLQNLYTIESPCPPSYEEATSS